MPMTANAATTVRMDEYTKSVLDSAARYTNQTRTAFMLSAALERAEAIIRERSSTMCEIVPMVLNEEDARIFLEALEQDYKPSQALLDLKKHYDALHIIDET
jgi:uncharacterized protein (DUF1778 family)